MPNQASLDRLFMDIAVRVSRESQAVRTKVGACLVAGDNIISMGWNGTPSGMDNSCEYTDEAGNLVTKPEVLHAESNALMKLVRRGGISSRGSTLYNTLSPCNECYKLIVQAQIARVVFQDLYRDDGAIEKLQRAGIIVDQLPPEERT